MENDGYVRHGTIEGSQFPYFASMRPLTTIANQGVVVINAVNITSHEGFGSACARYTSHSLTSPPFSYSLGAYVYTYRKHLPEMVHDPTGKSVQQFIPVFDNLYGFPIQEAQEGGFVPLGIAMTEFIVGSPSKILTTVATRGLFTLQRYTGLTTEPAWSVIAVRAPSEDPAQRAIECPSAEVTGGKVYPVMYARQPGEQQMSETSEIYECMQPVIDQVIPNAGSAIQQDDSYETLRDAAFAGIFLESDDGSQGTYELLNNMIAGNSVDPDAVQRAFMASMLTLFNISCNNKQDFYGFALLGAAFLIVTANRYQANRVGIRITMDTLSTFARYCALCCMQRSQRQNENVIGRTIGVAVPDTAVDIFIGQMQ